MKPEHENHEADDAFERKLAGFRRTAPPEEWRDELLANAIPELNSVSNPVPAGKVRRFTFSLPEKFFGGALVAAWLVIFTLWIATPSDPRSAGNQTSRPLEDSGALLESDKFPMLAWRFAGDESVEELLR